MESLSQVQTLMTENMHMIGLGLLVAVLLSAAVWYWMSRSNTKNDMLVNQARVNATTTEPRNEQHLDVPSSASAPEPMMQNHEQESE